MKAGSNALTWFITGASRAAAIGEIATTAEPPSRLQLGAACVARVEEKLAKVAAELARWRHVSLSTGYDAAAKRSGRRDLTAETQRR